MIYYPDKWMLIKINIDKEPHYKVFGSWSGGYLSGDSWRMNSGVVRVEETDTHYLFYGASGSCYQCHKEMYGATMYGHGVMQDYANRYGINTFSVLEEMPDVMNIDWMIN